MAKSYKQKHGIDYVEVFAPNACMELICLLISIFAQMKCRIYKLDYLKEEVYVEQPLSFMVKGA